jgi:hypothetical protein
LLSSQSDRFGVVVLLTRRAVFDLMLDTGSSDTTLPHALMNEYIGPVLNNTAPASEPEKMGVYVDGSWWKGFASYLNVQLTNTNISAIAPVIEMTSQSTKPLFIVTTGNSGLMGIGHDALSSIKTFPQSVFSAWVKNNSQMKNQIGIQLCPYFNKTQFPLRRSWIDFGNTN